MLLPINPVNPEFRKIAQVVEVLKRGGIIAYPTDTIYGIGCDIMNKKAIQKVYRLKQMESTQPLSFICSDLQNISDYAKVSNYAYKTMKRLLPGPYTFILEASKLVPKIMITKRKTAGIRVPEHAICMEIIKELGNPIISTSAADLDGNEFMDPSLLHDYYNNQIDLVIDGGPVSGRASSVVSLIDDEPEVLRVGAGDVSIFE
ncbi:L-threonylcarbamoyladenylate synthase [Desulfatibacillum aliphaticivorans]|uniref:Sua5/YciO/YrdC/YwlC family protein n=1 Tax=Desulfatibacillum aliphaticivorans TaxID=218208 RepID=B8FI69_DESAL|nr:L-threonylcarbamoyladenylate synthase [Desulfatibacillum aliphaticivorans]ACL02636.1 Sua5/YciO/YrdC/YwlC family protein [Desulfatibacillum aliphaticivorans]